MQPEIVTNLSKALLRGTVRDGQRVLVDYDAAGEGVVSGHSPGVAA